MSGAGHSPTTSRRERGLTLVELLVAMTVLALAMVITLTVYDGAKRSYHRGEIATEQQQIGRIALDLIQHDIRLAGLNLFPDGDHDRPDEPIEAAGERYLVLRADFDGNDPARADAPELVLSNGHYVYGTVSTGNDEIHGFVLARSLPDGTASGPDGFAFDADVAEASRDGGVESVTVENVVLTPSGGPYTLYRFTLDNDASSFGSPGFIQRVPLADNVSSLRFRYFDLAGNEIAAPGGTDDAAGRRGRASIARIGVELEILPRHNAADGRRPVRPFVLEGEVSPRNRDKIRIVDSGAPQWEPSRVGTPTLAEGHCGGLVASWPPNPAQDRVAYYKIYYGTDPLDLGRVETWVATTGYLDNLVDDTDYTVRVAAVNASGIEGPKSNAATRRTQNYNVPEAPGRLDADPQMISRIALGWDAVTRNTVDVPDAALRDLAGYRLYRSTSPGVSPDPALLYEDEAALAVQSNPTRVDHKVVSCRTYHYVVTAVDQCGLESAASEEASERTPSYADPVPPASVHAFFAGGEVRLIWDVVRDDVEGTEVWVDDYRILRAGPVSAGSDPPAVPFDYSMIGTVVGTEFRDAQAEPGFEYWYAVQAFDECGNESAPSLPARASCTFHGDVKLSAPGHGDEFFDSMYVEVRVDRAAGVCEGLRLTFVNEDDGREFSRSRSGSGPVWSFAMNGESGGGPFTPGWYRITAEVDQLDGGTPCTDSATTRARLR